MDIIWSDFGLILIAHCILFRIWRWSFQRIIV